MGFVEKPFEDGESFVVGERHDQICVEIVWINVEHETGKNPKIESFLKAGAWRIETFGFVFRFHRSNRRELLGIVAIGVGAILRVIDFAHEPGMRDGDVVALEIVVNVHLPIAIDDVVAALDGLQALELEAARLFGNFAEICGERLGVGIEIDEDKLFPGFETQRKHAHGAAVEEFHTFNVRCADQSPVKRVRPPVIATTENILAAAALRDRPGAMATDVAERAQRALFVADNDDWFADNIRCEESLWISDGALYAV